DGYIKKSKGCKVSCVINNVYCNSMCKSLGGSYGYCWTYGLACWCEGLPNAKRWKYETKTCK
uniref:Insect toxin BsIT2 n=1 Tax=Hottentotta tamulus sindicus TaxID=42519 RepID=SIX2_HOTTS|nr:RecName: Full=Insect toxin BsIT2; Short=Insect toxin 2; AltName: Full=Bs-dprIT2 [Mesobuthus tamulus sindicus]